LLGFNPRIIRIFTNQDSQLQQFNNQFLCVHSCEFELFVDRLTERARQRARELACDADPRLYGESDIRSPDGDGCRVVPDLCNKCAFTGGKMDRTDLERLISSAAGSAGGRFCTFHRCLWCPISCASTAAGVSHVVTGHYHSHYKSIDGNWRCNFYGVLRTERVE
jgi:hypothetical protein